MGNTTGTPVLRVVVNDDSPFGQSRSLQTKVDDLALPSNLLPIDIAATTEDAVVGWRGHVFDPPPLGTYYAPGHISISGGVAVYCSPGTEK